MSGYLKTDRQTDRPTDDKGDYYYNKSEYTVSNRLKVMQNQRS